MIIKSTRNTVAAAMIFSVLSGASTITNAVLSEVDVESVRVSYADLDLTSSEGQHSLYQRLRGAAQDVCGEEYSKVARKVRENRECREFALQKALRKVGNPSVAALHDHNSAQPGS
jgi:UrcA family protein